jgi:hydrogenase maturation protein HypF
MRRLRILVEGTVQGVGFRPFVYRIAVRYRIAGFVRNLGEAGVEIEAEAEPHALSAFLSALKEEKPPLAEIAEIHIEELPPQGDTDFKILPSRDGGEGAGLIPPDTATCDLCLADMGRPGSRFYGYWATSCTDCGPRFSVVEALPYDRPRTAFRDFPMCPDCERDYRNPLDRRYHAQTIACPRCGPKLSFISGGQEIPGDPISLAQEALREGKILAIKGLGGTHLACDATREEVVAELRRRLGRPAQPFALMAREDQIPLFADPDEKEWELLRSPRRPIVVLLRKPGYLAPGIAPGLHTVGVMLPYTGLHHLLLSGLPFPLVMTSANFPGRPMLIENDRILRELSHVADAFLLHNRRIVARCDDSVVRVGPGGPVFLRRSRGWVPEPISLDLGPEAILALGGDLNVTFAIYSRGKIFLSQHIGNTEELETLEFLEEAVRHFLRLLGIPRPKWIACDLHPGFPTRRLAEEWGEPIPIQHHVAHVAGLAGEHGVEELVGIAMDGYGYGLDGTAWGGEVILWRRGEFRRAGHLRAVPMPGADLAALRPGRMAASFLFASGLPVEEAGLPEEERKIVQTQLQRNLNAPWSTSAGRFLDAVAAWLGICSERTYEGEPAMKLEALAAEGKPLPLEIPIRSEGGVYVLDTVEIFRALWKERKAGAPVADLAATAQWALALGLARIALEVAKREGIETIGLTGGAAVNAALTQAIKEEVERHGLRFLAHRKIPPGDGGLSFGQIVQASYLLRAKFLP